MTTSHTPFPRVYQAHEDMGQGDRPAIRFAGEPFARVIATITLTGYQVGVDKTPSEWAEFFVRAANSHDDLLAALEALVGSPRRDSELSQIIERNAHVIAARAAIARAKGDA